MFYYPQFLKNPELVNIQVVVPGGWGLETKSNKSLHFLLEHFYFSPTKTVKDIDEWLWKNVVDFWSITSYESIRLNFTLKPNQVEAFVPILEQLVAPRSVTDDFCESELEDLQTFWQTKRDLKEDQALRLLFPQQNLVHPDTEVINNLSLTDKSQVLALWKTKNPYLIVLGKVDAPVLLKLSKISPERPFEEIESYQKPGKVEVFQQPERLGWRIEVPVSHIYELLMIELFDQVFATKFYFEYHEDQMFIWTDPIEYPHLLLEKIYDYTPTKEDFAHAKHAYIRFLERLSVPARPEIMEKLAELIEGLHGHQYQAATYPVTSKNLAVSDYFSSCKYEEFLAFYSNFWALK